MNVDAIAHIIRHVNQDGTIDEILDDAPNTWHRRQRYLWIIAYIHGALRDAALTQTTKSGE